MKILFIHTYYQQGGGEDAVFEQDCKLLAEGNTVVNYSFRNKNGFAGAFQFFFSLWNVFAASRLKKIFKKEKPDRIHLHNIHYAIGPIVIRTAKKMGIPVVMTLHNYRLLCPSASLLHHGTAFTESVNASFPWKAIQLKVYRNSMLQTFWLAFVVWFHKKIGTWKMCDRFLVQTEFAKNVFVNSSLGIEADKFRVQPNFVNRPTPVDLKKQNHFLFVGRLSEEKGLHILIDAINKSGHELRIAGDGPLKKEIETFCSDKKYVRYLGKLNREEVTKEMESCTALVFPSIWYEGMPMTILEALAAGTPVIASNVGAMKDMIVHKHNGLLFEMGNANELADSLTAWQSLSTENKNEVSQNSLQTFKEKYSPERYKRRMLKIYEEIS